MNKFLFKGYIGNIKEGKKCLFVSIATQRNYKNAEGEYESDWFNCVAFQHTAEFINKYFHKGDMIIAEGVIQNNNYENEDGDTVYQNSFIIQNVEFCGKNGNDDSKNNSYGKKGTGKNNYRR